MPSNEVVQRALNAIKRPTDSEYFFSKLTSPDWIRPLWEAGMFQTPPDLVVEASYVHFPPWPESQYLARMAAKAPELVLEVILKVPNTENVRVNEDFADAALAMPADLAIKLVPKAKKWLESPYELLLPEKIGKLVSHLANGGQIDAALSLAAVLLIILVPVANSKETDDESILSPEPRARFHLYTYSDILQKYVPDLVRAAKIPALTLLCNLLAYAIRFSQSKVHETANDGSQYWYPVIDGPSPFHFDDLKNLLVTAVREASVDIINQDLSFLEGVVETLEKYKYQVFTRLALHVIGAFPQRPELIRKYLLDHKYFNDPALKREYFLLAHSQFANLTTSDENQILGWINTGPDLEFIKSRIEEGNAYKLSDQELEDHKKKWQRDRLATLSEALPTQWQEYYKALVTQFGEPDPLEYVMRIGSSWGPTSPKSTEELRSMSVDEIIHFLQTWIPEIGFRESTQEGLSRELARLVTQNPLPFANLAERFETVDPTFIRGLINGLREGIKTKQSFDWESPLKLSRWVVEQPDKIEGRTQSADRDLDKDPDWTWTKKEIASLLSEGFEADEGGIPFELRALTWTVLEPLTRNVDPTPQYEEKYGGKNMDAATLSINTTRGEALHAVIRYALWVKRHIIAETAEKVAKNITFEIMPEVEQVLDSHLDPAQDMSVAVRSVYGWWLPGLLYLDSDWVKNHISQIFSSGQGMSALYAAAWSAYLRFAPLYSDVFSLLKDQYALAVSDIGTVSNEEHYLVDLRERLAEHLMTLYWYGTINLSNNENLLKQFFSNAPVSIRRRALDFIGQSLGNIDEEIEPNVIVRLKGLWETRLEAIRTMTKQEDKAELAAFGWWFASGVFERDWSVEQLNQSIRMAKQIDGDHQVVEHLVGLSSEIPAASVASLKLLIENDKDGWHIYGWRDESKEIIVNALRSEDQQAQSAAENLIHWLGARGFSEYGELLHLT